MPVQTSPAMLLKEPGQWSVRETEGPTVSLTECACARLWKRPYTFPLLTIPSPIPLKPFGGREAMQAHFLWLPGPGARGLRIGWCGLDS